METRVKKELARMAIEGLVFLAGTIGFTYTNFMSKPQEYERHNQLQQEIHALNSAQEGLENYFSGQSLTNVSTEYESAIKTRERELETVSLPSEQYRKKYNRLFWVSYGAMIMAVGSIFTSFRRGMKRN